MAAVVVTGGAGYVGTNLAAALLADGLDVRVVDLREPVTACRLGARWIRADVRDRAAMRRALAGADVGYHLASIIPVTGNARGQVESVNVDGVRAVAAAARDVRMPRLVHCSSVHAFDLEATAGAVVDESSPRSTRPGLPAYDRSKAAGEATLRRAVDRGLDAVVVNPTAIVGPIDEAPSAMGTVLLAIWRRRLPALVDGGFDWVDVADVVTALRAAALRGRTGENYLVPGHRLAVTALAELAGACSGREVTRRVAPAWAARAFAPLGTVLARYTDNPLVPTSEALRTLRAFPVVDGAKAARGLGHRPRPVEQTLTDLFRYFVAAGRIATPSSVDARDRR